MVTIDVIINKNENQNHKNMEDNNIKAPTEFVSGGMIRSLSMEGENALVYLVKCKGCKSVVGYEVWKKITLPATEMFDRLIPARIKKPNNEKFGSTAWAPKSPIVAAFYFHNMENGHNPYGAEWGSQQYVNNAAMDDKFDSEDPVLVELASKIDNNIKNKSCVC